MTKKDYRKQMHVKAWKIRGYRWCFLFDVKIAMSWWD